MTCSGDEADSSEQSNVQPFELRSTGDELRSIRKSADSTGDQLRSIRKSAGSAGGRGDELRVSRLTGGFPPNDYTQSTPLSLHSQLELLPVSPVLSESGHSPNSPVAVSQLSDTVMTAASHGRLCPGFMPAPTEYP